MKHDLNSSLPYEINVNILYLYTGIMLNEIMMSAIILSGI